MLSVRSCCSSSTTHDSPQKRRTSSEARWRRDLGGETGTRRRRAGGELEARRRRPRGHPEAQEGVSAAPRGLDARHRPVDPRPHEALTVCGHISWCVSNSPHASFHLCRAHRVPDAPASVSPGAHLPRQTRCAKPACGAVCVCGRAISSTLARALLAKWQADRERLASRAANSSHCSR